MPDWGRLFIPETSLVEIVVRGTLVYLGLLFFLRVILRRQGGDMSMTDLLLIVLIADASQNAMANEYRSITEGLLLVATLFFWDYALDWLSFRYPAFRTLVHPEPLLLISHGRTMHENLRRELITEEQLASKLREEGVEEAAGVKKAFLEGDGHISVIAAETPAHDLEKAIDQLMKAVEQYRKSKKRKRG